MPCPAIEPGAGEVVTGTLTHSTGDILDIQIQGESTPIGTTGNHPWWSEDRQKFIEASELKPGETLRTAAGKLTQIISITKRANAGTVYNLEVNREHVYYVGENGLLVHNTYVYEGWKNGKRYIGITKNINRRAREHRKLGRNIEIIDNLDDLSRKEARAVEQVLIERHGLVYLDNKINSIAKKNPIYDDAIKDGKEILNKFGL